MWLRRRGGDPQLLRAVGGTAILIAVQGAVGLIQYFSQLPAELVWVHVVLAAATWTSLVYCVAVAGRPREEAPAADPAPRAQREADPVGV